MPDDMSDEMLKDRIRALLEERAAVGDDSDRVRRINVELSRLGHDGEPPAKRAEKRPAANRAEKR